MNLVFELIGAAALLWTLCTESRIYWKDVWNGVDLLLALPTLAALLSYHADPPPALAHWCTALAVIYALNVVLDLAWLFMGRWHAVLGRSLTALADAGSLVMWTQCVYFHQLLARALARQQMPIAYVTVRRNLQCP